MPKHAPPMKMQTSHELDQRICHASRSRSRATDPHNGSVRPVHVLNLFTMSKINRPLRRTQGPVSCSYPNRDGAALQSAGA